MSLRIFNFNLLPWRVRKSFDFVHQSPSADQKQRNQVSYTLLLHLGHSIHHSACNTPLLPSFSFSKLYHHIIMVVVWKILKYVYYINSTFLLEETIKISIIHPYLVPLGREKKCQRRRIKAQGEKKNECI